jgi:hypothetical protein
MMLQEVPISKKLGENIASITDLNASIGDLGNKTKGLLDNLGSFQDKLFETVRKDLGLVGVGVDRFSTSLVKASDGVVKLGGNLNDVVTYFSVINKSLDRTTFLTEQAAINFRQLALVGVSDETIGKFSKFFDSVGLGVEDATQQTKNLVDDARQYGLNVGEFLTNVNSKISTLTLYGYPKGVNDLSKMVAQSQTLGVNLDGVKTLADGIMDSPERAFDIAAQLQTLGGSFAQLGDGASLLYDAQNDLPGLQDKIVKATASIASFNKESGQFEISAAERLRLRGAAKTLGMDVNELATLATKAASQSKIFKELDFRPEFKSLSPEDKQLIANYAQLKGGKVTIEGLGVGNVNIQKVLEDLKKGVGQFSDTGKDANKTLETTYKDSLSVNQAINQAQSEFNSTLSRSIIELEEWKNLTNSSSSIINTLNGKLQGFTDQILANVKSSLSLTPISVRGTASPVTQETVVPNESNQALMNAKMTIEGKSQMDINIKTTLPEDFQKQIQGQLQTMLPSIIDARVKEILDKEGYSK